MDVRYDERAVQLRKRLLAFMDACVQPAEPVAARQLCDSPSDAGLGAGPTNLSLDYPLARLWAAARTLRSADGPDEFHKRSPARREPEPCLA